MKFILHWVRMGGKIGDGSYGPNMEFIAAKCHILVVIVIERRVRAEGRNYSEWHFDV